MIEGLKPYPEQKDSGVFWLGSIPSHWEIKPGFAAYREKQQKNIGMVKKRVLSLSYGRIVIKSEDKFHGLIPKSFETYQIVNPGEIIIRSTDLQNDWTSLRVGLVRDRGIITSAYICLNMVGPLLPEYGYQQLNACDLMKVFYGMGSGLRQNLSFSDFKRMPIVIPPHEEQSAIVHFLNYANTRIDRAIQAKKKLIALLNEQKQAIIHHAVTRGIDRDTRLKRSELPWVSEFPAHWKRIPVKRLLSRMDYGTSEVSRESGTIRVLSMANIQRGEVIVPGSDGVNKLPDSLLLEHNDLLFTRTNGNPDLVGKVGIFRGDVSDRVSFASYLVRLRTRPPCDPQWLHMLLNSSAFWPFARSHALVNLQTNLNSTRYGQLSIPVPPSNEQVRISRWVENESKALNAALRRAEEEISLLREYRTRVIADVVTGKLDVREAARSLPETHKELPFQVDDEEFEEEEIA